MALGAAQPARRSRGVAGRHPVLPAPSLTMHVLRIRDFGFFLGGRFMSTLAQYMQWVAVGWYLYDVTGDPMTLAWATSTQQIGVIAGPALGGLLYLLGAPFTFAVCLALALLAVFAMLAIRTRVIASKDTGASAVQRAMAGLRYLRTQPIVLGAIS